MGKGFFFHSIPCWRSQGGLAGGGGGRGKRKQGVGRKRGGSFKLNRATALVLRNIILGEEIE